jgi:histidine ammonia-lyase
MTVLAGAILVDAAPSTIADVVAVAAGAPVEIGPTARARIVRARDVVDELTAGERLIYGLNTGLGSGRDVRVPIEELERYQPAIVLSHAGGIGPPLPTPVVRAAMFVRLAGMARGGAGTSLAAAESYAAMLNGGVHPVVPSVGSVGASDLMHMAAIASVAIGLGWAEIGGEIVTGAEALGRAGIVPLRMAPKDGLALVSANGVAVGHGALVIDRVDRMLEAADAVAALSLEASLGNPSIVEPVVAAAKPVPGQSTSAARIRALLAGSRLLEPDAPASVQDPLSFRVVPQVHGAVRELAGFARQAVDGELAAADDNPLVVAEEGRIVSNGNFHPMLLALAFEALRPGLAHLGRLSDRRMEALWAVAIDEEDPAAMVELFSSAANRAGPMLRYSGAARAAELVGLAGPATLDLAPLDRGVEDHGTLAPLTVARTGLALDALDDVLATELMMAASAIRIGDRASGLGLGTRRIYEALVGAMTGVADEAPAEALHEAVRALLPGIVAEPPSPA